MPHQQSISAPRSLKEKSGLRELFLTFTINHPDAKHRGINPSHE